MNVFPVGICARDLTTYFILMTRKVKKRNGDFFRILIRKIIRYGYILRFYPISENFQLLKNPILKNENIKNGNSLCFDPEFVESLCLMQGCIFSLKNDFEIENFHLFLFL